MKKICVYSPINETFSYGKASNESSPYFNDLRYFNIIFPNIIGVYLEFIKYINTIKLFINCKKHIYYLPFFCWDEPRLIKRLIREESPMLFKPVIHLDNHQCKSNIASIVMQTQRQKMVLNPFFAFTFVLLLTQCKA